MFPYRLEAIAMALVGQFKSGLDIPNCTTLKKKKKPCMNPGKTLAMLGFTDRFYNKHPII
jgi:hypothetical protein